MSLANKPENMRTFRDPDGYCWLHRGRVIRRVFPHAVRAVRAFHESALRRELEAGGFIPATRELSADEVLASGLSEGTDHEELFLQHDKIEFPSHCHEWSPAMLYAAGLLTLDIQRKALAHGYWLKDAAPSNVLFRHTQPMFVDYLSFQPCAPEEYLWIAEAQFVRNFVLPLLLHAETGEAPHATFFTRRDGFQPEEVYARLGWLARLKPTTLRFVSAPTWLSGRADATTVQPVRTPMDSEKAAFLRGALHSSLRKAFMKLAPVASRSNWSAYMSEHNYDDRAFAEKEHFVAAALEELKPRKVLDVGCNTGHFSQLANERGSEVVALDYDVASVDRVFMRAQQTGARILPLVVNLARPSPGLGWENGEQSSFLERARGQFDAALLLAVIHHLSATDGIPLERIFALVASLVTGGAVVEYVDADDSMMEGLLRNKAHLRPLLTQTRFEAAFAPWFTEVRRAVRPDGRRCLYFLKRKPST